MTEREKDLMSNPAEKESYADPADPPATTAFPTIASGVAILAIIFGVAAVMLLR
jgi:hypothetical protein